MHLGECRREAWPYDDEVSTASPTGAQIPLQLGDVTAQIAQVGASLRSLRIGGVDLVPPYPHALPTPACSGVVLVPWPNRVRDGEWDDAGTTRQLAITEIGRASCRERVYGPV